MVGGGAHREDWVSGKGVIDAKKYNIQHKGHESIYIAILSGDFVYEQVQLSYWKTRTCARCVEIVW